MGGEQSLGCCVHSVSVAARGRAVWPTREKGKREEKKKRKKKCRIFFKTSSFGEK
jgi:hypothetical protein